METTGAIAENGFAFLPREIPGDFPLVCRLFPHPHYKTLLTRPIVGSLEQVQLKASFKVRRLNVRMTEPHGRLVRTIRLHYHAKAVASLTDLRMPDNAAKWRLAASVHVGAPIYPVKVMYDCWKRGSKLIPQPPSLISQEGLTRVSPPWWREHPCPRS